MDTEKLQALIDRREIEDLVYTYCRAVDRRDFELLRSIYFEDAIDEHGGMFSGQAGDFVDWLSGAMGPTLVTQHQITNMHIVLDGDYGEGEIYAQAYHLIETPDGRFDLITGGRYLDKYEKREGTWGFAHRKIISDWNTVRPTLFDENTPFTPGVVRGGHFPNDPSHDYFRLMPRSDGM